MDLKSIYELFNALVNENEVVDTTLETKDQELKPVAKEP
jgi:hypothetical protein